jgi:hypothetical protein
VFATIDVITELFGTLLILVHVRRPEVNPELNANILPAVFSEANIILPSMVIVTQNGGFVIPFVFKGL